MHHRQARPETSIPRDRSSQFQAAAAHKGQVITREDEFRRLATLDAWFEPSVRLYFRNHYASGKDHRAAASRLSRLQQQIDPHFRGSRLHDCCAFRLDLCHVRHSASISFPERSKGHFLSKKMSLDNLAAKNHAPGAFTEWPGMLRAWRIASRQIAGLSVARVRGSRSWGSRKSHLPTSRADPPTFLHQHGRIGSVTWGWTG